MLQDVNRFRMFPELLMAHLDHALLLTNVHGHIEQGLDGFYRDQTRFLSRMILKVEGRVPDFVSANPVDTYSMIAYYLASSPAGAAAGPPEDAEGGGEIVAKAIEIQLSRFLGGGMHQDMVLTNHALAPATVTVSWELDADFADLTEARGDRPMRDGEVTTDWCLFESHGELSFRYRHDRLNHATVLRFDRGDAELSFEDGRVIYRLTLAPRTPVKLCLDLVPFFQGKPKWPTYDCESFHSHDTEWDHWRDAWTEALPTLHTPEGAVQAAWDRAVGDLGSLPLYAGKGAEVYTPAAGIPIYQALFGRDTLTASWQAGWISPLMLRGTLETIAGRLGSKVDDRYDEQPGRVIHQHELSPLALLGRTPYMHYYGDYAGPGMFLIAIAWYYALTGDRAFMRRMRDPIRRVLAWIDRDADRDGDGFYEYETRAGRLGTRNQGWKDSNQAILYPDGRLVSNPIAVAEVQGYVYAAKQLLGLVWIAMGQVAEGRALLAEASALKRRFNQAFYMPGENFYALALDSQKRRVASIASNVGHCLACGIIDHDRAEAVAARLMAPDMFSGWGIRTLSSEHPAYNPFAYHLGSVWPSENASIALGFSRYGLHHLTSELARGLFDAARLFDLSRLPEAIGGHPRDHGHPHPGIYPHSNAPQAWSASAVVLLLQSMLGLVVLAPANTLVIDPDLPEWLPDVTVTEIPVGKSRVSLRFRRDASGRTDYHVLASHGHPRVLRQPPPESLTAGVRDRITGVLESLLPH